MLIQYMDGIYVCDIKTSFEKKLYEKYDINIVLNFTVDYPFIDSDIKKTRIPVSNLLNHHTDIPLIKNNLSKILKYIYDNFINHNILICCHDGNTISPTIVGLFLHKYANIQLNMVKDLLLSKNKYINIEYDLSIFLQ
jgi:hypothetical protein